VLPHEPPNTARRAPRPYMEARGAPPLSGAPLVASAPDIAGHGISPNGQSPSGGAGQATLFGQNPS
jgi:hypothetical protein